MAPLKAKILISFILLIVLLMLPDEATSQRRRRGMIASNTAQPDSLQGNDSLKADTMGGAATLYASGKVNYQHIELAAEDISMNQDSSTVHA